MATAKEVDAGAAGAGRGRGDGGFTIGSLRDP